MCLLVCFKFTRILKPIKKLKHPTISSLSYIYYKFVKFIVIAHAILAKYGASPFLPKFIESHKD